MSSSADNFAPRSAIMEVGSSDPTATSSGLHAPKMSPCANRGAFGLSGASGTAVGLENPTSTGCTLIIGYGNPLRTDDAVGPHIVSRVEALLSDSPHTFLSPFQLTPELAVDIAAASHVIFIDASVALPPGDLSIATVHASSASMSVPSTHHCSSAYLLALAGCLNPASPASATVIAIGVASLDYSAELSPAVARTATLVAEALADSLKASTPRRSAALPHTEVSVSRFAGVTHRQEGLSHVR